MVNFFHIKLTIFINLKYNLVYTNVFYRNVYKQFFVINNKQVVYLCIITTYKISHEENLLKINMYYIDHCQINIMYCQEIQQTRSTTFQISKVYFSLLDLIVYYSIIVITIISVHKSIKILNLQLIFHYT